MELTPAVVRAERERLAGRAPAVVRTINTVSEDLSAEFDVPVAAVDRSQYRAAVDEVFADGDLAVNVTALVGILRALDVQDDYRGFVVDELLARELAGMLASNQPLRLLGEATPLRGRRRPRWSDRRRRRPARGACRRIPDAFARVGVDRSRESLLGERVVPPDPVVSRSTVDRGPRSTPRSPPS